jgi:membrane-associated phospholipid phosphatase
MASRILIRSITLVLAAQWLASSVQADAEEALSDTIHHVWHDQKQMITSPLRVNKIDLLVWGTAGGSLLYLAPKWGKSRSADERFEQGLDRQNTRVDSFLKDFTHVGDAPVLFGVTLTSYGLARWQDWPRVRTGSLHVFEGLMDAGIAAEVIKLLAGRRRPVDQPSRGPFLGPRGYFSNYSDNSSFVSGHAAMTFATATIISHESGSYWVGIPAYIVAGGVSYSRIYVERHWLSDVIGGAALGYSVGIFVEHRRHSKPQLAGTFYPFIQQDALGVAWTRTF